MTMTEQKLTREDVNPALLQRVADELNIGVPIHAWAVEEGRLKLFLAYGQEVVWPQGEGRSRAKQRDAKEEREGTAASLSTGLRLGIDYEWREVEGDVPPIPQNLEKLKKQVLVRLAIKHGIRIKRRKNFLKAEYVEVLERLRATEVAGDDVSRAG